MKSNRHLSAQLIPPLISLLLAAQICKSDGKRRAFIIETREKNEGNISNTRQRISEKEFGADYSDSQEKFLVENNPLVRRKLYYDNLQNFSNDTVDTVVPLSHNAPIPRSYDSPISESYNTEISTERKSVIWSAKPTVSTTWTTSSVQTTKPMFLPMTSYIGGKMVYLNLWTTASTVWTTKSTVWTTKPTMWSTKPSVWTTKPTVWTTNPTVWTTKPTVWTTKPTVWTSKSTVWTTKSTVLTTKTTVWTTTTTTWSTSTKPTTTWTTKPSVWTTKTTVWTTSTTTTTSTTNSIWTTQKPKSWTTKNSFIPTSTPKTYELNRLLQTVKTSRLKPYAMKKKFDQNPLVRPEEQKTKLLNAFIKLLSHKESNNILQNKI